MGIAIFEPYGGFGQLKSLQVQGEAVMVEPFSDEYLMLMEHKKLHEEDMDGKFDDILSQDDYFPESFFYQWIGFPESVFLYNEVFDELIEKELTKSTI